MILLRKEFSLTFGHLDFSTIGRSGEKIELKVNRGGLIGKLLGKVSKKLEKNKEKLLTLISI